MQAVLAWSALPHVGERSLLALLDYARGGRLTLADLWEAPLEDLRQWVRLHPRAVAALQTEAPDRWARAAADAEAIRSRGVDLLLAGEPDTPPVLHTCGRRWPLVFAYGALGLLEEPRAALVSSKDVSVATLAMLDALADALARRDAPLVTSTNRDVYKSAATAAKRHAGPTVLVLDRGIAEAFPGGLEREPVATSRVWDEAFDPDLQLLLSPFGWREGWNPRSGPRRDALLFDLADVVVAGDVRPDGTMERECRRARALGKRVLVLDRGDDTAEGSRRLWEADPEIERIRWTSGDEAAETVLRALPAAQRQAEDDRSERGWQREVAQFLARATGLASSGRPGGAVGVFPPSGVLAEVAGRWGGGEDRTAGVGWLLADLAYSGSHGPARLAQLLERVACGGYLAAIVPVAWLEDAAHARARSDWLRLAVVRMVARLPRPVAAAGTPAAAVLLERDGPPDTRAAVFAPDAERMGRFHLRRYLLEVLAALSAGR